VLLADATPLVWGGSVLAARAGRRFAEALRKASGRTALAADAEHLLPLIRSAPQRDIFADPFESPAERRPVVLTLDDGAEDPAIRARRGRLLAEAEANGVRHRAISCVEGGAVSRYAALHSVGQYVALYLALGLGLKGRQIPGRASI
jgi:Bacterial phospho-glucose isomerase C-terminal SIS domain